MNNIEIANVSILKQLIIDEIDSTYESYIYPVIAATQNLKKNLESKKFQPILCAIKPVKKNLKGLLQIRYYKTKTN